MDNANLEFLWNKLVICNTAEEAEKCVNENKEKYKNFMDNIQKIILESGENK